MTFLTGLLIGVFIGICIGLGIGLLVPRGLIHGAQRDLTEQQHPRARWGLAGVVMLSIVLAFGSSLLSAYNTSQNSDSIRNLQAQKDSLRAAVNRLHADETAQRDRAACQARVNANLIAILHSRAQASRRAILAPRAFFQVLFPALTAPHLTPQQIAHLSPSQRKAREAHEHMVLDQLINANHAANEAYQHYLDSQQTNPLPPIPTCN